MLPIAFLGFDLLGYGWAIIFCQRGDFMVIWVLLLCFLNFCDFDKDNFL